ncbi:S1 family peptidase [Streptomyces roseolilacinus]|uniref:Serine protease n=1 Tax=Streptomyces roseolilacinus TaxID=66904 RepID=A0A918EJN4_9ACTN|nr:S1 family peptidase [Streptomyces roseolilacinus]GGQ07397.1 serine protease [Streptomyces roseolilacinus]
MRRTTILRTALSSALLLATAALGFTPASAADRPAAPSRADASLSPGLLTAMRRDLGLTEEQAVDRLRAETAARGVEGPARRAAGASYGGSWFEADSGRLTVAVTDRARRAAVEATGADAVLVRHTARQLDAAKARIDRLEAPAGVASWHVDPEANTVAVHVVEGHRDDPGVRAFVARAHRAGPVTVRTTGDAPRTFAAGTVGGDPYYTGNVRCSIGFSVHGGFVTAGHCGSPGAAVHGWDRSYIGTFQGSSFPENDYAWVSVGSGWWTVPVVLGWGTVPDQLVRGSAEAPVGASVCRSGSTTRWHCGAVLAKNETVNYSQGAVRQMTKTSVCAEPGDSGGSFISGDQAQGVTSGGWGNCSGGGQTWHQPVNEILNRYGLRLHTT